MVPRPIIVSHGSSSSSLKNPCPSGTGIGYMNITFDNNESTFIVVCDKNFIDTGPSEGEKLALGLGLGLGIPALIIIALIIRWYRINGFNKEYAITSKIKKIEIKPRSYEEQLVDVIDLLKKNLTPEAFNDFGNKNLTETLKRELMHLRLKEGRDLKDVEMYAEEIGSIDIKKFIKDLNPLEIYTKENHIV